MFTSEITMRVHVLISLVQCTLLSSLYCRHFYYCWYYFYETRFISLFCVCGRVEFVGTMRRRWPLLWRQFKNQRWWNLWCCVMRRYNMSPGTGEAIHPKIECGFSIQRLSSTRIVLMYLVFVIMPLITIAMMMTIIFLIIICIRPESNPQLSPTSERGALSLQTTIRTAPPEDDSTETEDPLTQTRK